jgi:hypothetical protein
MTYPKDASTEFKVTTWDAFGYYMYNPSIYIYGDVSELKWVNQIDSTYQVTGGEFYQASQVENGRFTNKYLGGVALMQTPFFLIGHLVALFSEAPADGFSPPYQYAIAFAGIFYCLLGFFILRNVLLRYFDDRITALTLLTLGFGSNIIQYAAIDGAQSHIYIFPLYSLILWLTIQWHRNPNWKRAAAIGFVIGLATICRPTELIMVFIPLLWNTHHKEARKEKWFLVRKSLPHLYIALLFGIIAILPQLIYWKITTGVFIHNVGSKWFFFNPWFRVLFGVQNGFFLYTPIMLLAVFGFFKMKRFPFKRSVFVFCLLNIWIIMAWSDWRYGATYSTRAMVQSYPVFALAMGSGLAWLFQRKLGAIVFSVVAGFLLFLNLFQITQYNSTVLHYHDMNWKYYKHIFLNADPSPLELSLLDTDVFLETEDWRTSKKHAFSGIDIKTSNNFQTIASAEVEQNTPYLRVKISLQSDTGLAVNMLNIVLDGKELTKIRLKRPLAIEGEVNTYSFYVKLPKKRNDSHVYLNVVGWGDMSGEVIEGSIFELNRKQQ